MEKSVKKRNIIISIILAVVVLVVVTVWLSYYLSVQLPDIKKKEAELKAYNEFYAQTLAQFEEENQQLEDFEIDIAFLGDSLTMGYNVEQYYSQYKVTNRGIGGDTTHKLKDRLEVSVLAVQPKVCVMQIGGNNVNTMFEDYEEILITLKENLPSTKIVLVSHAPVSGPFADRIQTMAYNNVKIKFFAEKYGCEFVDIFTPLFDLETGGIMADCTVDGAHFTTKGWEIVTQAIKPVVDSLLG